MTAPDPPSGRAPDDERLARIRASQDGVVQPDETVLFLLATIDILTAECEGRGRELEAARECHVEQRQRADNLAVVAAEVREQLHRLEDEHADCSNLSHAEAARICEEAQQMRTERDAAREALAASRARTDLLASLLRRHVDAALGRYGNAWHAMSDVEAEIDIALVAARPDEPTTEGGATS